jgi:CRISPR-associated protein Cmr2
MRYTAINIGPIIGTMSMARKVKALWCASYMFSYLMECIVKEIEGAKITILSPATLNDIKSNTEGQMQNVGLYPDRIYFESELSDNDINSLIDNALKSYSSTTGISMDYLNVMVVSTDAEGLENIGNILKELNNKLDALELYNRGTTETVRNKVIQLIHETSDNALIKHAQGKGYMSIGSDEDIAKADNKKYSYNKYLCIVQADGDNMGKLVTSLGDRDTLKSLSSALLKFGKSASEAIKGYGGIPIYAGGDDLLFVAPVHSKIGKEGDKEGNIFDLIREIDTLYENVQEVADKTSTGIKTTMSYGISISYHKYPRYEALEAARELLFVNAKNMPGKNAIAWCLKKHSGTGFECAISKSDTAIYEKLDELLKVKVDDNQVSAIAHKLRQFDGLLDAIHKDEKRLNDRLDAMYDKIMDEGAKKNTQYTELTRELLKLMIGKQIESEKSGNTSKAITTETTLTRMYGMLRTAKFIRGEEDKNG